MSGIRRVDNGWATRVAGMASLVAQQMTGVYGAPTLVLAYPAPGATLPFETATVVFQYQASDESDPLNLRSLRVLVDGTDRTSHFNVTGDAAWGPIVSEGQAGLRALDVRARVCTVRGTCAEVARVVTVAGSVSRRRTSVEPTRWIRFVDTTLEVLRRLLRP